MTNNINTFSADMMRLEMLPSYAGDVQQSIADVSDMIFALQQNKMRDKAVGMMKLAAGKLKLGGLSRYRHELGRISRARIIDQAKAADKEAESITDSFQELYIGLYKENVLLDTFSKMLEKCVSELEAASDALRAHIEVTQADRTQVRYTELAKKKLHDLELSKTVALQAMALITDMSVHNSALAERINSLKVNTLVLWRSSIAALEADPDSDRAEKICGIEDVIAAAIVSLYKQ